MIVIKEDGKPAVQYVSVVPNVQSPTYSTVNFSNSAVPSGGANSDPSTVPSILVLDKRSRSNGYDWKV
jgi:hypothetical protein